MGARINRTKDIAMKHWQQVVWLGSAGYDSLQRRLSERLKVEVTRDGAADRASAVVTACRDESELRELVLGAGGLFGERRPGLLYVDISWVSEPLSLEIAAAAETAGAAYVRAPLTRAPTDPQEFVYTAMTSGKREAFDTARPFLDALADKVVYLGEGEQARAMTNVLDVMTGVSIGMWAEALVFGEAAGLDWRAMVEVMETSAIASPLIKDHAAGVAVHDYESPLTCGALVERLESAFLRGKSKGVVLTLTGLARQMCMGTLGSGASASGATAMIPWLEAATGLRHAVRR